MNSMRPTAVMAFTLLLPLTVACQPGMDNVQQQGGDKPTVEAIYASQQCGRDQATPSATWIDNTRQLEASIGRIRGAMLGGKPIDLPELDFQHEIVLLVEMGQQPTLGYRIALTGTDNLRITQNQAHLTLDWVQPPADAMVAQMISSPCLLLKLERGDYTSVQILDRQGAGKASTH